jgi:hypothetical protein
MFNLVIDSKLRGCDVVALKVEDVAPNGHSIDRATHALTSAISSDQSVVLRCRGRSRRARRTLAARHHVWVYDESLAQLSPRLAVGKPSVAITP